MHAISTAGLASTMTMVALLFPRKKESRLQRHWVRIILPAFSRIMGERTCAIQSISSLADFGTNIHIDWRYRLLTVGRTVDEAAILYSMLDNACHSQLLAEAAAASGVPKRIISHEVAQYTAEIAQNPVSLNHSTSHLPIY